MGSTECTSMEDERHESYFSSPMRGKVLVKASSSSGRSYAQGRRKRRRLVMEVRKELTRAGHLWWILELALLQQKMLKCYRYVRSHEG